MAPKVTELTTPLLSSQEPADDPSSRYVEAGNSTNLKHKVYKKNDIHTGKYNVITFIPLNLYQQFSKFANIYFIFIAVLQCIPAVSITQGQPAILLPLAFVVAVSAVKDLLEDLKRHKMDHEENNAPVDILTGEEFEQKKWREICVGDIVRVKEGERFPADLVLLKVKNPDGIAYIETKNLDGETNLKYKEVAEKLQGTTIPSPDGHRYFMQCAHPNPALYKFNGNIALPDGKCPLDEKNLVLRGCTLQNTEYIDGIAVYTGHESKIMLNSTKSKAKKSRMEASMDKQIVVIFLLQLFLCLLGSIYTFFWFRSEEDHSNFYLDWHADGEANTEYTVTGINYGTWFLIFANFVPISLIVTLEFVKFGQATFISWDEKMYNKELDYFAKVQSSNLNEELGQVSYIFSDKTGTLTCNDMEFRQMCIGGTPYGSSDRGEQVEDHINFLDPEFNKDRKAGNKQSDVIERFILHLAICHTVIIKADGKYSATSPDELAFTHASRFFGVEFTERENETSSIIVQRKGKKLKYKIKNIIEFSSDRKRMSVVTEDSQGNLKLLTKGADSIMFPRLSNHKEAEGEYDPHILTYAREGLRTLVIAEKTITREEYDAWNKEYTAAFNLIDNREEEMDRVAEKLETGFEMLGVTAIDDRLQDDVGVTIESLKNCGIKLWVLTGDKVETAINIGYSCKLLSQDVGQFLLTESTREALGLKLKEHESKFEAMKAALRKNKTVEASLVISGETLDLVIHDELIRERFVDLADQCQTVLACRVSPKQKAEIVRLIRARKPKATTLSIGDGANDVNMITTAHVGVGIMGKEGQQAVRASDFAIGQFSFLHRLLMVHGREAYRRNAVLICYNFYKNVLMVLPQFWFGALSAFSGQPLYDSWVYQFYNMFFTSCPPLVYAMFDKYCPELDDLLVRYDLYKVGIARKSFNGRVFFKWVMYGFFQGLILTMLSFFPLSHSPYQENGQMLGLWTGGSIAYTLVIFTVNLEIFAFSNTYHWFLFFFTWGSIGLYLIVQWLLCMLPTQDIFGVNDVLWDNPRFYAVLAITIWLCMIDILKSRLKNARDNEKAMEDYQNEEVVMRRRRTTVKEEHDQKKHKPDNTVTRKYIQALGSRSSVLMQNSLVVNTGAFMAEARGENPSVMRPLQKSMDKLGSHLSKLISKQLKGFGK